MADSRIVGYQSHEKKRTGLKIAFVLGTFVSGFFTATQHFAHTAAYDPALGGHIHRIYFPGMIAFWFRKWGQLYPEELRTSISYGMAASAILLLSYLIIGRFVVQSAKGNDKLHGTAHWATPREIKESGLLGNNEGVYVGAWEDKKGRIHYLRDNGPSHVLCFAPTRSGKGVGLVLPTLLSWRHSTVVSDLKGELWQLTSGWRKRYAGNMVFRFEPGSPEGSARWNPLDEVRLGAGEETGDIRNLTETIIDYKGKGLEDFWQQSAANLLEAVITHILYKREREGTPANMQTVAYFLSDPDNPTASLEDKFKEMIAYKHYEDGRTHKLVASMGNAMLNKPENERGSVISTMDSTLGIYKDVVTARNTETSDFSIMDIMNADKPVSLYLITTPDNKERLCPLLRLLINMMVKKLAAKIGYEDGRAVMAHKRRLLMMLDEFPSFGKLQPIADGLAFVAGYGIKIYIISQDTVQFDSIYTDKNSIISNCHIQVMFPPNRLETAKYISQMLGETTVVERQFTVSGKRAAMMHGQVSESIKTDKRSLLTPDEVMALPGPKKSASGDIEAPGEMIVRVAGFPPIRGKQPLYFLDPVFLARAKVPVPAVSDRMVLTLPENALGGKVAV
ncbi:MAG: type IV secretory system conjugative DNA transfer family protein [Planctomycetota bacterium]|jgi:type IV secretion system protein VirD4|nr:type IV secretory system conjugative DNA transfer family protein [Planctomycetota bacterium]